MSVDIKYNRAGVWNPNWQDPVDTAADLPLTDNDVGDVRVTINTFEFFVWDGATWQVAVGSGGSGDAFTIIQTDTGTSPVASTATDTLTMTTNLGAFAEFDGDAATDTVTLDFLFTPENVANKDNSSLSTSTTTYPTSGAVKTYVDNRKFIELTDTPANYTGEAFKVARVNFTENGLVFSSVFDLIGYTPAQQGQTDFISGVIEAPEDGDYRLLVNVPVGFTVTNTTTRSVAGTGTATFKINTTNLGGTANSVSTTEQTQAHASANVVAAGDDIVLTMSSVSALERMSFTIQITRTLA